MHYEQSREVTLAQRCNQCRMPFREGYHRYYCHNRAKTVCQRCYKIVCKKCNKSRNKIVEVFRCSNNRCNKMYDKDDMFYDFKKNYYVCPRCLVKDYNYYYQLSLTNKCKPKEVKLQTSSIYPYQDIVTFFKQWCFCCANRIGKNDAFEMQQGARICTSCVSANIDVMNNMIKCVLCDGYIRNEKQIYELVGDQTQVMCIYCAQTQKKQLSQVLANQKSKIKTTQLPSPMLRAKKPLLSAYEKSKADVSSNKSETPGQISRMRVTNSKEHEVMDQAIQIQFWGISKRCQVCGAHVQKNSLFTLQKSDPKVTESYMKLFPSKQQQLRICLICFGSYFTDRGQTIQFQTPSSQKSERGSEQAHSPSSEQSKKGLFGFFAKD